MFGRRDFDDTAFGPRAAGWRDLHVRADARAAAEAILNRLEQRGIKKTGFRTPEMAKLIAADTPDSKQYVAQPNTLDPRKMVVELDQVIPKDWEVVVGAGHYFSMVMTHMKGRAAERYHVVNDFGAIGSALRRRQSSSLRIRYA